MRAARQRMEEAQKDQVHLAWMTARLIRAQKIPAFEKLLKAGRSATDPEEIRARLAGIASALPKMTMAEWRAAKGA